MLIIPFALLYSFITGITATQFNLSMAMTYQLNLTYSLQLTQTLIYNNLMFCLAAN